MTTKETFEKFQFVVVTCPTHAKHLYHALIQIYNMIGWKNLAAVWNVRIKFLDKTEFSGPSWKLYSVSVTNKQQVSFKFRRNLKSL